MITGNIILNQLINIEKAMFRKYYNKLSEDELKKSVDTFIILRRNRFKNWPEDTLRTYGNELEAMMPSGRNVVKMRMERMENISEEETPDSEHLEKILDIEKKWLEEVEEKEPDLFRKINSIEIKLLGKEGVSLEKYLKSELETYSKLTLELYYRDLKKVMDEGKNIFLEAYKSILKEL